MTKCSATACFDVVAKKVAQRSHALVGRTWENAHRQVLVTYLRYFDSPFLPPRMDAPSTWQSWGFRCLPEFCSPLGQDRTRSARGPVKAFWTIAAGNSGVAA